LTILLDTNACIALINGRPPVVRDRTRIARERGERLAISTISLFELWFGVAKSTRSEENAERLADFLSPLHVIAFDEDDAYRAGHIRAALERLGLPIGAYDYLIAAQAVQKDLLLVTANVGEFSRIEGLRWEDWSRDR
jgi:tRNA(fMet)-specific endonuclease VapC